MFLYVVIALATLAYFLYWYFTRTFNYWKNKGVIGPKPVPLFGNIKDSAFRRKNIALVCQELYDAFPNQKVIGIYRMTTPCLLIRDLDIIKHIMIKDFDVFTDRGIEFSTEGLGQNLFHADGDTWQVLRNRLTPLFTSGKLKNMLYLMDERGDRFVNYIDDLIKQEREQEVHKLVQKFTIATISACAFGLDIDTYTNGEAFETLKKVDDIILNASYANELDMMFPGVLKILNISIFPAFVTKFVYGLVTDVIAKRKGRPTNRKDFMDLILELRQQGNLQGSRKNEESKQLTLELTDNIIAAQAFSFYLGGYETSATTLGFLLYEIARNPDVQDKLIADVDNVLQQHSGKLTYECIKDMTYLKKVFDETLRMYPLVEPILRNAKVDYKIPETDVTIPKGMTVLVSALGIQHDDKYYPDPEKFDPERHTTAASSGRHLCAYMPFGLGPRNCIGMRFAKIQSRVCLIKFFSHFRVELSKNTMSKMEINPKRLIMGPDGGIYLNIVRRK